MKIEYTQLFEIDETSERQRITQSFTGVIRKRLLVCLDDFVAGRWDTVTASMRTFTSEELEFLHPVVFRVINDIYKRNSLKDIARPEEFEAAPDWHKVMGGTDGGVVSMAGLEYPKFVSV